MKGNAEKTFELIFEENSKFHEILSNYQKWTIFPGSASNSVMEDKNSSPYTVKGNRRSQAVSREGNKGILRDKDIIKAEKEIPTRLIFLLTNSV